MVAAELARRAGASWASGKGLRADICQTRITSAGIGGIGADAAPVVLLRSKTYMNESGIAVGKAARYFQVEPAQVVVIHDELDIDFGRLRLKAGGGDNGHNGLKSIRAALGTGDFLRVRVGIGRPPGRQDPADFVLSGFAKSQADDVAELIERSADAVECLLIEGLQTAQNTFNS
jgi:PTH1 family peptidyl-tRNA hydrolase